MVIIGHEFPQSRAQAAGRAIDTQGACSGEHDVGQGKAAPMPLQHGAALDVTRTINTHNTTHHRHIQGRSTCKSS
jgi:hypothetical protein